MLWETAQVTYLHTCLSFICFPLFKHLISQKKPCIHLSTWGNDAVSEVLTKAGVFLIEKNPNNLANGLHIFTVGSNQPVRFSYWFIGPLPPDEGDNSSLPWPTWASLQPLTLRKGMEEPTFWVYTFFEFWYETDYYARIINSFSICSLDHERITTMDSP